MKSEIRSFEDLKVWQLGREIRNEIFERVKSFPKVELYRLTDQMIRSSRSITDQIAEGYGRFHYQENIQYCRQARGSAYELKNQLITALDCKYISKEEFQAYNKNIVRCIKMINGYINYLRRAKKDLGNSVKEDGIPYHIDIFKKPNNE
ncbi:MAG: four helix bundle protein [Balneolaceae bacterium]|nr:four helix bundle protein [Balneolaceae bacterium]